MPDEVLVGASETEPRLPSETGATASEHVAMPEAEPRVEGKLERASEQYSKILSQVQPGQNAPTDTEVDEDATTVGTLEDAEKKVHHLVELAQVKGVAHAVQVAKRMNDLYVLDTMHDELADKLYEGLVAKGLLVKE